MRAAEIRWGPGFNNVIHFDPMPTDPDERPHLLDDIRTWRRPVPGSEKVRNDAGTTDSWVAKRDYLLAGVARYFGGQGWGALGVQDFLDWAGEGNTFRLIPDRRYPSFYVADCHLEEPFDDPRPDLETSDGSQSTPIVIRQQATDFTQAMRGVMFEYLPGMDITKMGGTFSRPSAATYIDRNGVLQMAAAGVLRDAHYIAGVRHALTEKTSTNLCLESENLGLTWGLVGTPTRVAAGHTVAGVTLDLIGDDDGVSSEGYSQSIPFTDDGEKSYSFHIKQSTSTSSVYRLFDSTAGEERGVVAVAWSAGLPVVITGGGAVFLGYEPLADGVFRIYVKTSSVVAANANALFVYPAQVVNLVGGANTGTVYTGGVQAENSQYPTSYIKTTTGTVGRNADELYFTVAHVPQELTGFASLTERGTVIGSGRIYNLGGAGNPKLSLLGYSPDGGEYRAHHHNGGADTSFESNAFSNNTPAFGDVVELRQPLAVTGQTDIGQSINGGAEIFFPGNDPAGGLAAAWSQTRLYIGGDGGSVQDAVALRSLRIMAGDRTLAAIRAA